MPIRLVLLAVDDHQANLKTAREMRARRGNIALTSTARFTDEAEEPHAAGVDVVFDLFSDAGVGFAESVRDLLEDQRSPNTQPV